METSIAKTVSWPNCVAFHWRTFYSAFRNDSKIEMNARIVHFQFNFLQVNLMARRMCGPKMKHEFYRCGRHCLVGEWCYRSSIYFAIALCALSRTQNLLAHKMQMDATEFIIGVILHQLAAKKLKGLNFDFVWRNDCNVKCIWTKFKTRFSSKRSYTYIPHSRNQRRHPHGILRVSSVSQFARSPVPVAKIRQFIHIV